ncbi:MAG TPA: sigma-70 family RNA polymerase sigma factor [Candidatus Dormibacteraeota bacterium]|jgi:RNA polymerase sigma-70 factor (ECF subfamily)|nr:sigma-70 family RNA polymerase sigma factor [Candidatus Dormibacteraeota bacterium]
MSGSLLVPDAATDLDRTLVARCASGDADALGLLYDRYGRVVFGVLQALLPSPEAAEEVAQDAFHAVWRRARDYDASKGSVRTWLFAIARNAAIDWRRTRGKRTERERPLEEVGDRPDPSADALVERAVRGDRVRAALAALPAEQREVVVLAYYLGYTQDEIARRTNAPVGTVKGRARLAMAKLREALAEER